MGRLFTYELQLLVDKGENGLETRLLGGVNDSLICDGRILFTRQRGRRGYGFGQRYWSTSVNVACPKVRHDGLRTSRGTGCSRVGLWRGVAKRFRRWGRPWDKG